MLGSPRVNRVTAVVALLIGVTSVATPVHAAETWTQQGADIDGIASMDINGWTVAMSADGTSIAVGAPGNSVEEIRNVIDAVRSERTDKVTRAGS